MKCTVKDLEIMALNPGLVELDVCVALLSFWYLNIKDIFIDFVFFVRMAQLRIKSLISVFQIYKTAL